MRTCMQESAGTVDGLVNSVNALRVEMEHIKFDLLGGYLACKEELKQEKHKNKKHVEMAKSFRERLVRSFAPFSRAILKSTRRWRQSLSSRRVSKLDPVQQWKASRSLPKNLLRYIRKTSRRLILLLLLLVLLIY